MAAPQHRLHTAVVLEPGPQQCVVGASSGRATVGYAAAFGSRAAELRPGQLVAVTPDDLVVWRWFDAVVLGHGDGDGDVQLWEPAHGEVRAQARRPEREVRLGSRAYLSGGLPGAEWWVAGPTDVAAEEADVELDEVVAFYDAHDLWSVGDRRP